MNSIIFHKYIRPILLFPFLAFMISCQWNEQVTPREYPRVRTLSIGQINEEGARVEGEIFYTGSSKITDYGFVWSRVQSLDLLYSDFVSLGPTAGTQKFNYRINSGLVSGQTYYVSAYIKSEDHTVYGNVMEFSSEGSKKPIILDFFPKEGQSGDTVTITGAYFSRNQGTMILRFGNKVALRLYSSPDTIRARVPIGLLDKPVHLSIEFDRETTQSDNQFFPLYPAISSISPTTGTYGDIVEISGQHFQPDPVSNKVWFDSARAKVVEASREKLRVEVPTGIKVSPAKIRVQIGLLSTQSVQDFHLTPPQISGLTPAKAMIGETLEIQGNYFSPAIADNLVYLSQTLMEVVSASKTSLTVKIPSAVFDKRETVLRVVIAGQEAISPSNFTVSSHWIKKALLPQTEGVEGRVAGVGFELNGALFLGLGNGKALESNRSTQLQDLWKFDIESVSWTQSRNFPDTYVNGAIVATASGKAIVGMGQDFFVSGANKVMYSYEPANDRWLKIATYPGRATYNVGAGLGIGSNVYVCMGYFGILNFFQYNTLTNTWTNKANWPLPSEDRDKRPEIAVSYNGKGYMVTRLGNMNDELWEYDPVADIWTQKAAMSIRSNGKAGFILGDALYVVSGSGPDMESNYFYRYHFASDSWEDISYMLPPPITAPTIVAVGDKAYLMGGRDRTGSVFTVNKYIWEFDPNP